jgi:hypothetical protein
MTRVSLELSVAFCLLAGGQISSAAENRPAAVLRGAGSFEDPAAVKWFVSGDAKGEISTEHATEASHSLKVDVCMGGHPGVGIDFPKPMDFSAYYSLRFSLFNATGRTNT